MGSHLQLNPRVQRRPRRALSIRLRSNFLPLGKLRMPLATPQSSVKLTMRSPNSRRQ